jgi:hypothetical protein
MGFSTVLIISLAAGVVLIVGGGLMMYMGNLVKSAYEIKVQINTDVEERLTKMGEDLDKKSRWIKRDLLEEIEKIKVAVQTDNARKLDEMTGPLLAKLDAFERQLAADRADWVKAIDADRTAIAAMEARVKTTPRPKAPEAPKPLTAADAHPSEAPAPMVTAAAEPPAAPVRSGPTPVGAFLQEL